MNDNLKCFHPTCTVSPRTGGAVYRVNAKGVPGIWACEKHIKGTDATIPPETLELTRLIENRGSPHQTGARTDGK